MHAMRLKIIRHIDLRLLAVFLILVPACVWGSGGVPFQPAFSVLTMGRAQDAWTHPLFKAGIEAVVAAKEMRESPQDAGNDFKVSAFSTKRVVNPDTAGVAAEVPTTGAQAADDALVRATLAFLATLGGGDVKNTSTTFTPSTRAFGKYLFVTLASAERSEYTTIAVTKDGAVDMSTLFGVGYDGVVVEGVANILVSRFAGLTRESAVDIAKKALTSTSFRLASNGLVVSVPTKPLPNASAAVPYHEVLVPMSVVEQYVRK
jgi:hypothetical protein